METIVANVTGKVRRESRGGRDYFVAPLSLLPAEGVLAGSSGAIFYPADENARSAHDWDGMPIVVDHPVVNGIAVSARDPDILAASEIGRTFRTRYADKLAAEGWFDIDAVKRVSMQVHDDLAAGRKIELSTGLDLVKHPAASGAAHNGTPYDFIGRDYKPDHVAVLPDRIGACSLATGCGVNNAKGKRRSTWDLVLKLLKLLRPDVASSDPKIDPPAPAPAAEPVANELSHEQVREQLQKQLKSRFTQNEPYAYIMDVFADHVVFEQGYKSYRLAYSLGDGGVPKLSADAPTEVVREINYVPTGEQTMNRAQLIEHLTTNCSCWKRWNGDFLFT